MGNFHPAVLGSLRSALTQGLDPVQLQEFCLKNVRILLANSMGHNLREKIYSHRCANPDKNRMQVLLHSTIIRCTGNACRLIVISPAVSVPLWEEAINTGLGH